MVTKLPDVINPPKRGPMESVDEIPTRSDYYNGDEKLNLVKVNCKINANPTDCIHQSSCGWCGSYSSCILGNAKGPLEPCVKSTYIYSGGLSGSQPAKIINENVGNIQLTVATN